MRKNVVSRFYEEVAKSGRSMRWTSHEMLNFDVSVIQEAMALKPGFSWIDIGCGTGEVQNEISGKYRFCLGVDPEIGFKEKFLASASNYFLPGSVGEIKVSGEFDLASAFGVVTHLTEEEELDLYMALRSLSINGVTIVKHQCSLSEEMYFDGYSENLKADYSSRYPSLTSQINTLESLFDEVRVIEYPSALNKNDGCGFFAFVCKNETLTD